MTQDLEIITHGEPSLESYTESEKITFFTTLYARLVELANGRK